MTEQSYPSVLKEVGSSLKEVVISEVDLMKIELKQTIQNFQGYIFKIVVFSLVAALGALPLIAFLVIGLAVLLDGNYLLSSLIVGLVFAGVGGILAYRAFDQLTSLKQQMPKSLGFANEGKALLGQKLESLVAAAERKVG